jgi:hypothetical protein
VARQNLGSTYRDELDKAKGLVLMDESGEFFVDYNVSHLVDLISNAGGRAEQQKGNHDLRCSSKILTADENSGRMEGARDGSGCEAEFSSSTPQPDLQRQSCERHVAGLDDRLPKHMQAGRVELREQNRAVRAWDGALRSSPPADESPTKRRRVGFKRREVREDALTLKASTLPLLKWEDIPYPGVPV